MCLVSLMTFGYLQYVTHRCCKMSSALTTLLNLMPPPAGNFYLFSFLNLILQRTLALVIVFSFQGDTLTWYLT